MTITKDLLTELIVKALPYPEQIKNLNTTYSADSIRFEWRGNTFKVDTSFYCSELEGELLMGTDKTMLLERLIKKYYLDYL